MSNLHSDHSIHFLMQQGTFSGLSGTYVDYFLRDCNASFKLISALTKYKLEMVPNIKITAYFSGFRLNYKKDTLKKPNNITSQISKLLTLPHHSPSSAPRK